MSKVLISSNGPVTSSSDGKEVKMEVPSSKINAMFKPFSKKVNYGQNYYTTPGEYDYGPFAKSYYVEIKKTEGDQYVLNTGKAAPMADDRHDYKLNLTTGEIVNGDKKYSMPANGSFKTEVEDYLNMLDQIKKDITRVIDENGQVKDLLNILSLVNNLIKNIGKVKASDKSN